MKTRNRAWAAALAAAAMLASPVASPAQEAGRSVSGSGAGPVSAEAAARRPNASAKFAPKKVEGTSRAAPAAGAAALKGLSAVSRSRDGKETVTPPGDDLKRIVEEGEADAGGGKLDGVAPDPALDEKSRQVFGADDRVRINGTTNYPFSAIGYLEARTASGSYFSCSAALIGPRTVLTAAQCLYNHDDGGWMDEFVFYPGMRSFEDWPLGGYDYDTVTIQQAYIDDFLGSYEDVMAHDIGVVTLQEPIGDELGWLGYRHYDGLGDFSAHLVAYPGDKPGGTMWRSDCDVLAEDVGADMFTYRCDTTVGTGGGAVYVFVGPDNDRVVLGIDVAEGDDRNFAVRLNRANVEWIDSLWQ